MNEEDLIKQAMAALGRRKSDRKTAAARENARKPRPNRKGKKKGT